MRGSKRSSRNTSEGFTLIELLVSMTILGILSVLGLANFQSARLKARDAKRKNDLQTIAKSLEAYVNDHNAYPSASSGKILCKTATTCDWGTIFEDDNKTLYAAKLPIDDLSSTQDYYYYSPATTSYTLYARLENEKDPSINYTGDQTCGTPKCNYKITSSNLP